MCARKVTAYRVGPLDLEAVKAIIPQRFPFIMIDRVKEVVPGKLVSASKHLTGNEWFYQGHFPERAITPGAMLLEAIAQAGIVFFHYCGERRHRSATYLLGAAKVRYLQPVYPGSELLITVTPKKIVATAGILLASVSVEKTVVAKGEVSLGMRKAGEW